MQAHRECGDIRKLVLAGRTLKRSDFQKTLQEDLVPIAKILAQRCKSIKT